MTWKQFLTEKVLGEPKATSEYTVANNGDLVSVKTVIKDRTFDNRNDLMDLYQKVYEDGKWEEFYDLVFDLEVEKDMRAYPSRFTSILFCLDGKGYENRCKNGCRFLRLGG